MRGVTCLSVNWWVAEALNCEWDPVEGFGNWKLIARRRRWLWKLKKVEVKDISKSKIILYLELNKQRGKRGLWPNFFPVTLWDLSLWNYLYLLFFFNKSSFYLKFYTKEVVEPLQWLQLIVWYIDFSIFQYFCLILNDFGLKFKSNLGQFMKNIVINQNNYGLIDYVGYIRLVVID